MINYLKTITKKEDILNHARKKIFVLNKKNLWKDLFRTIFSTFGLFKETEELLNDFAVVDISLAESLEKEKIFKFPPNHPQPDNLYLMNSLYPNKYIPAKDFNRYNNELKLSSLLKICAGLGAKKILIDSLNIDGKEIKCEAIVPIPIKEETIINADIKIGSKRDKETGLICEAEFGEKNKDIKEYDSPWLETETTWQTMCNLRKDNDLKNYLISCKYNEVDIAEIEIGLEKIFKFSIKGSKTSKVEIKYQVVFW